MSLQALFKIQIKAALTIQYISSCCFRILSVKYLSQRYYFGDHSDKDLRIVKNS